MGRDRLRRGYSLEVIFEEESDFCSHLDSLDSVPHHQFSSSDSRHTLSRDKNNNYFYDKDFSPFDEELIFGLRNNLEDSSSSFILKSEEEVLGSFSDFSGSRQNTIRNLEMENIGFTTDIEPNEIENCYIEWEEFSPDSLNSSNSKFSSIHPPPPTSSTLHIITNNDQLSHQLSPPLLNMTSGRRSRVSRRQIVEANWIVEDDDEINTLLTLDLQLVKSPDRNLNLNLLTDFYDIKQTKDWTLLPSRPELKRDERSLSEDSRSTSSSSSQIEVKRVRALFENSPFHSSSEEDSAAHSVSNSLRPFKKSNIVENKINEIHKRATHSLNSAYSHVALDQIERHDYADLLVNHNIVIEDSPDIFKIGKENRSRAEFKPNLRRSKSMGTGIQNIIQNEEETDNRDYFNTIQHSRPCIIAEELPARNTVKNVRSVFENLVQLKSKNEPSKPKPSSLSFIKSNPTSKIFRSESMRDNLNSSASTLLRKWKKDPIVVNYNNNIRKREVVNEESSTDESSLVDDEPKIISEEVLKRIRSLGTTTTYYGGEIVGKTVKNRKVAPQVGKMREVEEVEKGAEMTICRNEFIFSTTQENRGESFNFRPRIVSMEPKASSPTKSASSSVLEERNSPEGCESSSPLAQETSEFNNNLINEQNGTSKVFNEAAWF